VCLSRPSRKAARIFFFGQREVLDPCGMRMLVEESVVHGREACVAKGLFFRGPKPVLVLHIVRWGKTSTDFRVFCVAFSGGWMGGQVLQMCFDLKDRNPETPIADPLGTSGGW